MVSVLRAVAYPWPDRASQSIDIASIGVIHALDNHSDYRLARRVLVNC